LQSFLNSLYINYSHTEFNASFNRSTGSAAFSSEEVVSVSSFLASDSSLNVHIDLDLVKPS
jgi:hypothetical protein